MFEFADINRTFSLSPTFELLYNLCKKHQYQENIKIESHDLIKLISETRTMSVVFEFLEEYGFIKTNPHNRGRKYYLLLDQLWGWVRLRDRITALEHIFMHLKRPKGTHSWIYLAAGQDTKWLTKVDEYNYRDIGDVSYFVLIKLNKLKLN